MTKKVFSANIETCGRFKCKKKKKICVGNCPYTKKMYVVSVDVSAKGKFQHVPKLSTLNKMKVILNMLIDLDISLCLYNTIL